MGTCYKALLEGNVNPIVAAKTLKQLYGGDNYSVDIGGINSDDGWYRIVFDENMTLETLAELPWARAGKTMKRNMVFATDGSCAGDYANDAVGPMTIVSLGHSGDCRDIIDTLVLHFGGMVCDEAKDDDYRHLTEERMDELLKLHATPRITSRKEAIELLAAQALAK